jgi:MFS family permease
MWASLKLLATSPAYCLVLSGASLVAFLSYGKSVWVLVYFQRTHKLSVGQTAIWVGVILGIAGIVGTWLGGWAADKFGSKDRRHMLTLPAWAAHHRQFGLLWPGLWRGAGAGAARYAGDGGSVDGVCAESDRAWPWPAAVRCIV